MACTTVDKHFDPDRSRCEIEAGLRNAECATVYAFAKPWPNELGHVELCVPERYLDLAESKNGPSWPSDSERFTQYTMGFIDPPCFWCCQSNPYGLNVGPDGALGTVDDLPCMLGCNAYLGCFCEVIEW